MKDTQYYKEQLTSLKDMFARTTDHMQKLQDELKVAKDRLEESQESMNQSIAYAKKIQEHLLPIAFKNCVFDELCFDVYQRDQIGGDFVYVSEKQDRIYFGLMDCTGHGIPGALLTMMGYNFLSEIILSNTPQAANKVMQALDDKFQSFFSQKYGRDQMRDGMDGVLCSYDINTHKLQYCMAGRPFWAKTNGKWFKHRPDRNSIGGSNDSNFKLHELTLKKGDEIFLFSDGLTDQFGGPKNKKFLTKRLYTHLNNDNFLNLKSKVDSLKQKLNDWQGDEEQTDDIAYIAIKV